MLEQVRNTDAHARLLSLAATQSLRVRVAVALLQRLGAGTGL